MSENHQIRNGPGPAHGVARDQRFQDMRIGKHVSCPMESMKSCVQK